ncbi:Lysine-specific demethylase 8 [Schistosoma japonicum]|uniref:Lysine-specific demethylase 8 n=1 Tax=Schistosoma japonicum TaxID=6182 RepID=A0A4Z2DPL9_SCHJA|nr:Lysine-specific demethylase 8 [Schistosoma japonicum]TNN18463.1 Lysine-specific demethylase 8 [Schistosoma japonicum]
MIQQYLDQNAPHTEDFQQLIQSYHLEFGVILLRDYKHLLEKYDEGNISCKDFTIHANYILQYTWEKLHTGHWKNVHICWRKLYASLKVLIVLYNLYKCNNPTPKSDDLLKEMISQLDYSLIMGYAIFDHFASKLANELHKMIRMDLIQSNEDYLYVSFELNKSHEDDVMNQVKVNLVKLDRINCPSIEMFNKLIQLSKPFIITNAINFWPAYYNQHKWTLNYWRMNFGYRLIPIEIGTKYTDDNWGQKLLTINQFIDKYFRLTNNIKGYLAQYEIFSQIPELQNDICIPDYCTVTGDLYTEVNDVIHNYDDNNMNSIEMNIWFGPNGTISPLHHDNDRANLLTQINGFKYVILYPASQTDYLYAYHEDMLCNTSRIDLDNVDFNEFPEFSKAHGFHGILSPGEMLYIPPRCWHYVRSLSASFSVNFWWNISSSLIPPWR